VMPLLIEIWQDGAFRLHDRFVYRRMNATAPWTVERLSP
jgi:pyridoxamine 5'-phosphate oxidase